MPAVSEACPVLAAILDNNLQLMPGAIRRVLIMYEDPEFFLGDNCIILYKIGLFRNFFGEDTLIDINFLTEKYLEKYQAICKQSPGFSRVICLPPETVAYNEYDVVLCISADERPFLDVLRQRYTSLNAPPPRFAVFSFSQVVFVRKKNIQPAVFPLYEQLRTYMESLADQPYELFLSPEEQAWGNKWLEERGMQQHEQLFVLVDNASHRQKLLRLDTYYKLLLHLLDKPHSRILIFDESGMGKEAFYRKWLGDKLMERFIFSNGLKLREDLCLIGSAYTKLVFGPCTGLLHCASGIFNHLVAQGAPVASTPALIVYTGPWDAQFWWDTSPLIDCLVLRNTNGRKEMATLQSLDAAEKARVDNRLDCSEYTKEMLADYIDQRLNKSVPVPVN